MPAHGPPESRLDRTTQPATLDLLDAGQNIWFVWAPLFALAAGFSLKK